MAQRVARWLADQVFKAVANWKEGVDSEDDDTVYLQCGKLVFDNVPASLRTELWLSQLHRSAGKGAAASDMYASLLEQGTLNPDVLAEIDKDTHRTFPGHPRLSQPDGQRAMLGVLAAYAILDPDIGYCQGMNFLAGLLLSFLPREEDAFGVLVLLMQERQLRELYKPDMSLLQVRLWQLGKLLPARLAEHLESLAVVPVLYASAWLLTCFGSDFPIAFAARVLDVVITDCYAAPMMKVAVGIMEHCSELLLEMGDMELILQHLKQDVPKWPKPVLQDLLTHALGKPWTNRQLQVLSEMNGAETVVDCVSRVNELSRQRTPVPDELTSEPSGNTAAAAPGAGPGEGSLLGEDGLGTAAPSSTCSMQREVTGRTLSQFSTAPTLGALTSFTLINPSYSQASPTGASVLLIESLANSRADIEAAPAPAPAAPSHTAAAAAASPAVSAAASAAPSPRLNPLPPPPGSRAERVAWEDWNPMAALEAVPAEQLYIEPDIRELPELEPSLTQALSSFRPSSADSLGSAGASATATAWAAAAAGAQAAAPTAAAAGEAAAEASSGSFTTPTASPAGSGLQSPSPGRLEHVGSLGLWGHQGQGRLSPSPSAVGIPSPFESSASGFSSSSRRRISSPTPNHRASWPSTHTASPSSSAGGGGGSGGGAHLDNFGSFQSADTQGTGPAQRPAPLPPAAGDLQQRLGRGPGSSESQAASAAGSAGRRPGSASKPPLPLAPRVPSEGGSMGSQASGLSHLLGMLSVGSSGLHTRPASAGQAVAAQQQAPTDAAGAAAGGPQPPSAQQLELNSNFGSWKSADSEAPQPEHSSGAAAAAELDHFGSYKSADSEPPTPILGSTASGPQLPLLGALQQRQQQRLLGRSISQPPGQGSPVLAPSGSGAASPLGTLRARAQSDPAEADGRPQLQQQVSPARVQQLQEAMLEGFRISAAPRKPSSPMRDLRRAPSPAGSAASRQSADGDLLG